MKVHLMKKKTHHINPFTPTDLYGMFHIKVWTIPFWILWIERVKYISIHWGLILRNFTMFFLYILYEAVEFLLSVLSSGGNSL